MSAIDWINLIIFVLKRMNEQEALRLLQYFYPKAAEQVSPEMVAERWAILGEAAQEVDYEAVQRIMKKLTRAYEQVGDGMVLTQEATYEVVAEELAKSANAAEDTVIFNRFVQAVVQKVK